ncbi:hypothetical protein MBLNU457_7360t1 [Dothideomycetes sp. NU457]
MGSASSQLKATQPVTPSQKQALTARALPENELETQPSLEGDFCPIQSALRKSNTALPSSETPGNTDALIRDKHEVDAVAYQADMAKKKKDKRSGSRPTTPVDASHEAGDQDVSMELDEPNTQLRREMLLSQQQHDARAAEAGENRQDESPAKKKKERKRKRKSTEGAGPSTEKAEVAEPESVQAAEVAQSAPKSKKRKRKSKADKEAAAEVEGDTIRVAASSGWQAVNVNANGSDNNDKDTTEKDNDEPEQPPAKKRKRKSKAAAKEADSTPADPETLLGSAAEQKVPAERPKPKKGKAKDDGASQDEGSSSLPKSGAFTPIEIELIATTIDGFREVNSLSEHDFNALVQIGVKKSTELKDLLGDILQTLPNRNSQAIRRFLERKYHNCHRGPWTADEDEELRLAFADHPNEWKKIAGRLNRMAEDCRDRWRNHTQYSKDQRNKDIWTPEEEQQLLDAIETCISRMQEAGQLPADIQASQIPEDAIQWKVVSEIMDGKRNRLQCSYKWKKLKYRAWRKQQEANGTKPPRRKPQRFNEKWISAERVTAEDDEDDEEGDPEAHEEGDPEVHEAAIIEEDWGDGGVVEEDWEGGGVVGSDAAESYIIEPDEEVFMYGAQNLDGIAREPEKSIERHTLWHQRYDVGDWYSMLREMYEIYNDFKSAGRIHEDYQQYWDVLQLSFDHGNWDNDDRMRSLDRCCRGLHVFRDGFHDELFSCLMILERSSSTRDLERTIMGRRRWPYLSSEKQYRSPSDSDGPARPRTPASAEPGDESAQEEPAVESEPVESAGDNEPMNAEVDNEPIEIEDDAPEGAPPTATLDENDPSFWDPISPPTQAPQLMVSKKTPRAERTEAGPSKSSSGKKTPHAEPAEPSSCKSTSTKKRASYGKMSKHKWTPAKSFYEDENDPIEDSQAAATANVEAEAEAETEVEPEAENDVNQIAVEVANSAPQEGGDAAAAQSGDAVDTAVEGAAAEEKADAADAAQSRVERPTARRRLRPLATQSQEIANDLRPFDEASLDARGADEATPAGHYVIYEPAFDHHSSEEEDEESQDSSDVDVMAVDEQATPRQAQDVEATAEVDHQGEAAEQEAETVPLGGASDDEEEMRDWRLRELTADRDAADVEGANAITNPDEDETMEDATGDHEKDAVVDISDDSGNDSDDDSEESSPVAPKLEALQAESAAQDSDKEHDTVTAAVKVQDDRDDSTEDEDEAEPDADAEESDEENDTVAAAVKVQDEQDDSAEDEDEDDEQKPAQSHSVVMAEPELGSPFRSQSPEAVVRNTQARSVSSRTSSVVSSDSEEEEEVENTQLRSKSTSRSSSVVSSDSEEEAQAETAQPQTSISSRASSVVSSDSDSEEEVEVKNARPQSSSSSSRTSSVVSSDSEEEAEVNNTRSQSGSSRRSSSSRSSSVVSSGSERDVKVGTTQPQSGNSSRSSSVVSSDSEQGKLEAAQQQRNSLSDQMSVRSEDEIPKSSIVPVTQTQTKTQLSQRPTQAGKKSKATSRVNRAVVKQESESVPESDSDEELAMTKKARRLAKLRRKRRDEDLDLGSVNGR